MKTMNFQTSSRVIENGILRKANVYPYLHINTSILILSLPVIYLLGNTQYCSLYIEQIIEFSLKKLIVQSFAIRNSALSDEIVPYPSCCLFFKTHRGSVYEFYTHKGSSDSGP